MIIALPLRSALEVWIQYDDVFTGIDIFDLHYTLQSPA